jgi:dynein heavy chain
MRESNIPKFISDDLPLFQALIQDLFPGVKITRESKSALDDQVEQSILKKSLSQVESF